MYIVYSLLQNISLINKIIIFHFVVVNEVCMGKEEEEEEDEGNASKVDEGGSGVL